MAYELFANKGARRLTTPAIGITKTGRFNLNKATTQILRAKKAEFVLLYWDPDHHKIGMKPSKKDSRAYQIGYNEKDNSSGFHGGSFLKHIGFDNSENRMLFVEVNEKEGMLEIEVPPEFLTTETKSARKLRVKRYQADDGGG